MAGSAPAGRHAVDLSESDEFRIFHCKILPCRKRYSHDWNECVFAHAGEKIQRRCPRKYNYMALMCPEIKKFSVCPRGDACCYAHNSFEYWLHASRYRTEMCTFGAACTRSICFFAHTPSELRTPVPPSMPAASATPQMAYGTLDAPLADPSQLATPTGLNHALRAFPSSTLVYGNAAASSRGDQAAWSTGATPASPPPLAAAMSGLSLGHQGSQAAPSRAPTPYTAPMPYPPAAPLPSTPYTDAMPYPPSAATPRASYPILAHRRSSGTYPILSQDPPHPQPTLTPPSTLAPTLRPAYRAATFSASPATPTLHGPPEITPYPTLRATAPSALSASSSPYLPPSPFVSTSPDTSPTSQQHLHSLPSYEDQHLHALRSYEDTPRYPDLYPLSSGSDDFAAGGAAGLAHLVGDGQQWMAGVGPYDAATGAGHRMEDAGAFATTAGMGAGHHQVARDAGAYLTDSPVGTAAMQHEAGLLAVPPYLEALGSMALEAQVASCAGMMYPYVQ